MKLFTSKILNQTLEKSNILKYLSAEEIEFLKKKNKVSLFFKIKRKVKFFFFIFFNKNATLVQSRSLEQVKNKYENISGIYLKGYLNKNRSFFAEIEDNKIVKLKGGLENYYSQYLVNIIKKTKAKSFLEVGAGELTLLYDIIKKFKKKKFKFIGALDIAFKRLLKGKDFLNKKK